MTTQEWINLGKEKQMEILNPLFEIAKEMLLNGVLRKNVIGHFTLRGLPLGAATNIVDVAVCRAEEFSHYKLK